MHIKLIYFLFIPLLLVCCKKEDAIKNKLNSGNGKWKISHYERYIWDPSGSNQNQEFWCNDCGEIDFNKNETGERILNYQAAQFKYSISAEKLIMYVDNSGIGYDIAWNWKKNEFTLTSNMGQAGYSEVISCKK